MQFPLNHASQLILGAHISITGLHTEQRLITSRRLELINQFPRGKGTFQIPTGQLTVCGEVFIPGVSAAVY